MWNHLRQHETLSDSLNLRENTRGTRRLTGWQRRPLVAKSRESSVTTNRNTNFNLKKGNTGTFYHVIDLQGRTVEEQSEPVDVEQQVQTHQQ